MDRLISEKKAIEAINDYWGEMETPTIDGYINAIKTIPSAEPKTGHWIFHYDIYSKDGWYECSCCHTEEAFNTNFCPDCGAKMVEKSEVKQWINALTAI